MASVDLLANAEDEPQVDPPRGGRLTWDPSVGPTPLGFGWDAEPVVLDWYGEGRPDLLVGVDDLTGYWPDSPHVPTSQQKGFNQKGGHPGYDRNGLWRGATPTGRLYWLRNVGATGSPAFELQPEIMGESHPLDVGM